MSASFLVKTNTVHFEEEKTAILSMTKANTVLEEMDGCN